ncbi:hypothetical protein ACET3Z_031350 [Daucus carota]
MLFFIYQDDSSDKSWRLFTSEDMIQGYKPKSVRKRKIISNCTQSKSSAGQQNISENSAARFSYSLPPFTPVSSHSVLSDCTHALDQTRFSAIAIGANNRRSQNKPADKVLSSTRVRLGDISNRMGDNSINVKRPSSHATKANFKETSKTLFGDEEPPNVEANKYLSDDDIECSTMADLVFSDSSESDYLSGINCTLQNL